MSSRYLPCRCAEHAELCEVWFDHETSASLELPFAEPHDAIDTNSQQLLCEYASTKSREIHICALSPWYCERCSCSPIQLTTDEIIREIQPQIKAPEAQIS
jgi:hypothetical protein